MIRYKHFGIPLHKTKILTLIHLDLHTIRPSFEGNVL